MAKAKCSQIQWLAVSYSDVMDHIRGKRRVSMPKDAEIIQIRSGECFGIMECLVRSAEYQELSHGMAIPSMGRVSEHVVSISFGTAHSIKTLLAWFKGLIKAGKMPETENRSDELTIEYVSDLMKELSNAE